MTLKTLKYHEYNDDPRCWNLERCDFTQINLVVGRNATGKTRLVNVINGLCKILSARLTTVFESGTYEAEFAISGKTYLLYLEFKDGEVIAEHLDVDGSRRLSRDAEGKGQIYYDEKGEFISFQVPTNIIAIQQRRDELQHPFVVELSRWALGCQTYFFGTPLGRDQLVSLSGYEAAVKRHANESPEAQDLVRTYIAAFSQYGEKFDKAIMRDMKSLGYKLSDVGTDDLRHHMPGLNVPEPLIGMFVVEADRQTPLVQSQMSQGMFRALALIIHINAASFGKKHTLVLVDDIGEGLDFERSARLIDILVGHAKKSALQIIMTTNDRFVMNRVSLEYWIVLRREKSTVRAFSERNSQKEFANFRDMGLSNFDLFTSASFK
jgi:predicted ATPase